MKILKADQIIIGDSQTVLKNGAIVINDYGRIESVGQATEVEAKYSNSNVFNYEGSTILPGLIDMHVHIGYWWNQPDANELGSSKYSNMDVAFYAYSKMQEALTLGVTTIRTVTDIKGLNKSLKKALEKQYITGPRLISSEQGIAKTGGHGWALTGGLIEADGPWEVRKAVRENIKNGADWIKAMGSDGPKYFEYTQEELDAIVDECHRIGYKCALHATTIEATRAGIEAGFDTLEHSNFLYPELAKKAAEKDIAWVPTMYIHLQMLEIIKLQLEQFNDTFSKEYKKYKTLYKLLEDSMKSFQTNLKNNYETGMKIVAGTDVVMPTLPITPIADEIELMVKLGLTPLQAIECATGTPAKVLDMQEDIGLLKEGNIADILVVDGNPVDNIKNLKNIKELYRDGELVYKK